MDVSNRNRLVPVIKYLSNIQNLLFSDLNIYVASMVNCGKAVKVEGLTENILDISVRLTYLPPLHIYIHTHTHTHVDYSLVFQ